MRKGVAAVVVITALIACGDDSGSTVVLDAADTGRDVALDVGDQIDVQLEANPTTGYSWELGPLPDGLELVSSDFEEPGGSLVGAAGTQVFVLDVVDPGDGILRFEYVRVFDDPVVAEKIVEHVLTIGGD